MSNDEAFEHGMTARIITFIVETEPLEDDGIIRQIGVNVESAWSQLIRGILKQRDKLAGNPLRSTDNKCRRGRADEYGDFAAPFDLASLLRCYCTASHTTGRTHGIAKVKP